MIRISTKFYHCHSLFFTSIRRSCRFNSTMSGQRKSLSEFDAIVLGSYKDGTLTDAASKEIPESIQKKIQEQLRCSGLKGKLGEVRMFYGLGENDENIPKKIAVVALGINKDFKQSHVSEALEITRKAVAVGTRSLRELDVKHIGVDVMLHEHGAAEGATLGLYRFDSLKSVKNQKATPTISPICSTSTNPDGNLCWDTGLIYAQAQNHARKLAETPANHMTPTIFAETVKSFLHDLSNIEIFIHDKEWAVQKNMGSFLSVARGSDEPLKFLEIRYNGGEKGQKPLAFVGKGITFDSGGISIKPSAKMAEMKGDMGGAAAVSSAIYGIAKLCLPINVVISVPLCENMPSGHATKPGDVVNAMNGKSIEVDNTDAEGRLILADALYYTSSIYKPHSLIDVATLTGAMVVALGEVYSGVFTNSNKLWEQLLEAGKIVNDPFWRMPLDDKYSEDIKKSTVADLVNVGQKGVGGSCVAAIFLKEFVSGLTDDKDVSEKENNSERLFDVDADVDKKIRYAHLDIAGSMITYRDSGYNVKGMTGRPTRSLIEFARLIAKNPDFC